MIFTAKELDKETGLYYYGMRYLDSKYSRWISTDPALAEYIPDTGKGTADNFSGLPGMGGVYNTVNASLYHYAGNNPVKYTDPDGRETYDSEITEKQYGNSFFLHQQMSWEEVRNFFNENPNGVLHRPEDQFAFMKLDGKNGIIDPNSCNTDLIDIMLVTRGVGKLLSKTIGKTIAKKALSKNLQHHILSRHTLSGLKKQVGKAPLEKLLKKTIFNPKWSNKKVLKASEKAVSEAFKHGVTNGTYITTIYGETVTAAMRNGIANSVYGDFVVTLEMLK